MQTAYVQYGSLGVQAARVSTNGTLVSGANLAIAVSGPASIDSHYINGPGLAAGPAYGAVIWYETLQDGPRSAGRVVLPALDGDQEPRPLCLASSLWAYYRTRRVVDDALIIAVSACQVAPPETREDINSLTNAILAHVRQSLPPTAPSSVDAQSSV
jgi:hypothetical protein